MFEKLGFKDKHMIAITEYCGDIVAVPCEECMSGIYPDYKQSQPILMGWLEKFELFNHGDDVDIDAIIFRRTKDGYEILFAVDSWDGFQPITDSK